MTTQKPERFAAPEPKSLNFLPFCRAIDPLVPDDRVAVILVSGTACGVPVASLRCRAASIGAEPAISHRQKGPPRMDPKIIVMISTLVLPSGDSGVHVKPFASADSCIAAADIEATDPFVHAVECAELDDGMLTLRFGKNNPDAAAPTGARPTG